MNHDDYESLPTTSVSINMTAGGLAGILEHVVMYPLDSVKVSTTTTTTTTTSDAQRVILTYTNSR